MANNAVNPMANTGMMGPMANTGMIDPMANTGMMDPMSVNGMTNSMTSNSMINPMLSGGMTNSMAGGSMMGQSSSGLLPTSVLGNRFDPLTMMMYQQMLGSQKPDQQKNAFNPVSNFFGNPLMMGVTPPMITQLGGYGGRILNPLQG